AAARRPVHRATRPHRLRWTGSHGALVSAAPCRRARRPPAAAQDDLPHVQRLHDRAAARARLRVLSARSVLRRACRRRTAEDAEGSGVRSMTECWERRGVGENRGRENPGQVVDGATAKFASGGEALARKCYDAPPTT